MTEQGFFGDVVEWFGDPANWTGSRGIPVRALEHLEMSVIAVIAAAIVAIPLGLAIGHARRGEFLVVSVANIGRAIPTFGLLFLFGILVTFGLGTPPGLRPPILFALTLLAIPPILTNTYVGIQTVDPDTVEAARGMGMSEWQVLRTLEIPIGAPLIVAGLRTAAVQVIATATLAAVIAGGGLGRFIIDGFAARAMAEAFGGAILVAILAIITELGFEAVARVAAPRTTSEERRRQEPLEGLEQYPRPADFMP